MTVLLGEEVITYSIRVVEIDINIYHQKSILI